jgi:hypothetical protein
VEDKPNDPLDAFLNAAVKTYVDVEPLNGLDERILNRAGLAQPGTRLRYRPLLAVAGTLAVSCWIAVSFKLENGPPKHEPAVARIESHIARVATLPLSRPAQVRHRRPVLRLPKRKQFPTPEQPTAEERALLHFVERDPNEAAEAFSSLQRQMDMPLEIPPLEIKPLQTDEINN